MPIIREDGSVGWFYYESNPGDIRYIGIDRSATPDRCFLHVRPVFEDGTVGPATKREITFGQMVAQKATLELIRRKSH
jgi:hypothetical protein